MRTEKIGSVGALTQVGASAATAYNHVPVYVFIRFKIQIRMGIASSLPQVLQKQAQEAQDAGHTRDQVSKGTACPCRCI